MPSPQDPLDGPRRHTGGGVPTAVRAECPPRPRERPRQIGGLTYSVRNASCFNVGIGTTTGEKPRQRKDGGLSSYLTGNALTIQLRNVALECKAHVDYGAANNWAEIFVRTDTGFFSFTSYLDSSDPVQPRFPDKLSFGGCQAIPGLSLVMPNGSATTKSLAPLLDAIMGGMLSGMIQEKLCSELLPKANDALQIFKRQNGSLHNGMCFVLDCDPIRHV